MLNKKVFFLSLFLLIIPLITLAAVSGCTGEGCKLDNPLDPTGENPVSPQQLIGKVIIAALGIVGSIALLMFIYGGFVWMTAAGNQEMVTRGRNILMWAAIGLVIIFSSYALVKFVFVGLGAMTP